MQELILKILVKSADSVIFEKLLNIINNDFKS